MTNSLTISSNLSVSKSNVSFDDYFLSLYSSELTLAEIADKLAISRTSLRNKITDMGLKREPRTKRKNISKEDILELEAQGFNYKQIAEQLNIHPASLIIVRKRLGIYNPPKAVMEQQRKAYQTRNENKKNGIKSECKYRSNCLEIYLDEILKLLNSGISRAEVARIYNVSTGTVFNLLALYDIKVPVVKKLDSKKDAIKRWFNKGLSVAVIANKLNCSSQTVEKKIKELGLKRDLSDVKINGKLAQKEKQIKKLYLQGFSLQDIGAKLNIHQVTICKKIKRMGLTRPEIKYKSKLDKFANIIIKMRKTGKSYKEIGACFDAAPNTVANYLKKINEVKYA